LIPDKSIDMILCDLPYGTTACKWDTIIPFEPLWAQYERLIKDNGAIVLTASQPFTTKLVASNMELFRYEWIYEKTKASNFMLAKKQPMKHHENVCVFYKKQPTYNPQMTQAEKLDRRKNTGVYECKEDKIWGGGVKAYRNLENGYRYPKSVQRFNNSDKTKILHPTQKPVALFEYLIRTYTNEGEIVLDNCMGSGTTAIAALNTNRKFIGFETEPAYIEIANKRIDDLR
jgi:site-specific DNA-methyltransferase (adenine-specific)